ncbi:hypothetical protein QWZ13_14635 [Reinekea marina]|uniref:hypothetical protein n=1 Tax=Reinekea marina TaxID=1310421 RepID=UPI0025B39611|nr:hypothetical protein [Reinekea marina]MDN3650154.1 hypothetical protein [Reinekea marina]
MCGQFYFCGHLSQEGEVERCMDARKATRENETGRTSRGWLGAAAAGCGLRVKSKHLNNRVFALLRALLLYLVSFLAIPRNTLQFYLFHSNGLGILFLAILEHRLRLPDED